MYFDWAAILLAFWRPGWRRTFNSKPIVCSTTSTTLQPKNLLVRLFLRTRTPFDRTGLFTGVINRSLVFVPFRLLLRCATGTYPQRTRFSLWSKRTAPLNLPKGHGDESRTRSNVYGRRATRGRPFERWCFSSAPVGVTEHLSRRDARRTHR